MKKSIKTAFNIAIVFLLLAGTLGLIVDFFTKSLPKMIKEIKTFNRSEKITFFIIYIIAIVLLVIMVYFVIYKHSL